VHANACLKVPVLLAPAEFELVYSIGSVYFAAKMPTATAWLELLCHQSKAWQKRSKNKR